jgi:hypothetical protein
VVVLAAGFGLTAAAQGAPFTLGPSNSAVMAANNLLLVGSRVT